MILIDYHTVKRNKMVIKTTPSIEHKDMFVWINDDNGIKRNRFTACSLCAFNEPLQSSDRSGGNEHMNKCILELQ